MCPLPLPGPRKRFPGCPFPQHRHRAGCSLQHGMLARESLGCTGGSSHTWAQLVSICPLPAPWAQHHLQSSPDHPPPALLSAQLCLCLLMALQLSLPWQRLITKITLQGLKKRSCKDMGAESPTLFIFVFLWQCACHRAIILLPG